ncbi:aldo/keto reductase [Sphingopyxis sp.]|uniref:aldo/keto reductase n=1 Tax=Sphingopyxis sp. TaxID=1908224 RepID=UPI002D775200|nr:aldo/keto reductase [Sphingopyxis sp.]HET6526373.1 aldo/keto reductase [Sphingopyxis sp.]
MADHPNHFAIGGDLVVHRIGFGAARLHGKATWGEPADPEAARAVLRRAAELGVNFIDTAEAYGPHHSERLIADALSPFADDMVIATKCGMRRSWPEGVAHPLIHPEGGRAAIRASLDGSLARLRLDRIELYQLHRLDPEMPLETTIEALAELRDEGRVRHLGLSEVTVEEIKRARQVAPIATVQNRYSLTDRDHEDVLAYCEAEGIAFIPWYPLGAGSLTAADGPLAPVAARHGASPGQVALAWLLARSPVILAIPGTTSIAHLEQNCAATNLHLAPSDLREVEQLAA